MFITNAGLADVLIVAAKTDPGAGHRGITTFLVERGAEGMTLSPQLEKLGWHASDTREVAFDECFVAADGVLGEAGRGFHQIMEAFRSSGSRWRGWHSASARRRSTKRSPTPASAAPSAPRSPSTRRSATASPPRRPSSRRRGR
jgi:alkylation response protein AidB-like acyl-CoA dehydrogenase